MVRVMQSNYERLPNTYKARIVKEFLEEKNTVTFPGMEKTNLEASCLTTAFYIMAIMLILMRN